MKNKVDIIEKKLIEMYLGEEINIYDLEEYIYSKYNYSGSILPYVKYFEMNNTLVYEYLNVEDDTILKIVFEKNNNTLNNLNDLFNIYCNTIDIDIRKVFWFYKYLVKIILI